MGVVLRPGEVLLLADRCCCRGYKRFRTPRDSIRFVRFGCIKHFPPYFSAPKRKCKRIELPEPANRDSFSPNAETMRKQKIAASQEMIILKLHHYTALNRNILRSNRGPYLLVVGCAPSKLTIL